MFKTIISIQYYLINTHTHIYININ